MERTNAYYVYFLVDPRSALPFYVGKGKNGRAYKHLKEKLDNTENNKKLCKIKAIRNDGFEPQVHYIYKNLDENIAYNIEEKLIKFYGRDGIDENGILTNINSDSRPPSWKGKKRAPFTKEHKDKIKEKRALQVFKPRSAESKQRTSLATKGKIKGWKWKPEQIASRAASNRGQKRSESFKKEQSLRFTGVPKSEQHRKATSVGIKNWWKKRKQNGN